MAKGGGNEFQETPPRARPARLAGPRTDADSIDAVIPFGLGSGVHSPKVRR
jgi:hypothetical protein